MSDELLEYYNRELDFLRHEAGRFAADHPKIAERLRLGPDSIDDPHVERLIEAFAYLTARIRHKIDDELPEVTSSLLDVLYPHYQRPIPSMAIVQFRLDPQQVQITSGQTIAAGSELETEPVHGEPCRYRTCYPVTLWPMEVRQASLSPAPFIAPDVPRAASAVSVLRLALATHSPDLSVAQLGLRSLRFFIRAQQHGFRLYELILNNTLSVALAGDPRDAAPIVLERDYLSPVGFAHDEGMLPYPARSFLGYRLVTEYFAFPQKFLFFDLALPPLDRSPGLGTRLELFFYLNRSVAELGRVVTADTFALGCTPIVNLYRQRAEPVTLAHTSYEVQVVPDRRQPLCHEVYSIDRVTASPPAGEAQEFPPFFSVRHASGRGAVRTFWHGTRRPAEGTLALGDRGTEVFLSLVDLDFRPSAPADWTLDVETTCLNRDLPRSLPFGGGQPRLQMREGKGSLAGITCVTAPTATLRLGSRRGYLWRLVSHLSLNHLSLVDDPKAEALREILRLYDIAESDETRRQIDGLVALGSRRAVGGLPTGGALAFCRGQEVTLEFDEEQFTGGGLFLFASVLERFLALYCTTNAFVRTVARVKGRREELRRWPARIGENVLV